MHLVSTDKIIHERCNEINNDKTEVLFFCFLENLHVNQQKKTGKFHLVHLLGANPCILNKMREQHQ